METIVSTRREFIRRMALSGVGALAVGGISGRGREGRAEAAQVVPAKSATIPLDSNENPHGPSRKAIDAIQEAFGIVNRYPDVQAAELRAAVARRHAVAPENVALGCGSTEILRASVAAFTSRSAGLVTAAPSFEAPARYAEAIGSSVVGIPVTKGLLFDLDAMAAKARGSGLVYLCNPNNPTATQLSLASVKEFVARVTKASATTVLVDEAYFDYVEDPDHGTAIPLAMGNPRVVVARTFSKIFGLAGLRAGYAVGSKETIEKLRRHILWDSLNVFAGVAASASLESKDHVETQRRLNREARELTRAWFENAGYHVYPSQVNFFMVDVRRDSRVFRDACRERGVSIGRPFRPLVNVARISIGTLDEMRAACEVFGNVLA